MTTSMMQRDVHRAVRSWNRALLVAVVGEGFGGALGCAGVIVLLGRGLGAELSVPAAGAAVLAACGWAAWRMAHGRVDATQMTSLLDLRLGGRGDVLHALESDSAASLPCALSELTSPRPDGRRLAKLLLPGLAFFGLALLVPIRHRDVQSNDPLAAMRLTELRELALALDETLEFDESLREEVRANLDSIEEGARDDELTGEALHEALDRIEQLLANRAGSAAEQLELSRGELARAAADALSADEALREEALSDLGDLAKELEALGALPDGLTAEQLANMSPGELAKALSTAAAAKLAQLAARGLLNSSQLAAMGSGGQSAFNPLKPLPHDPTAGMGLGQYPGGMLHAGGRPGAGAPTRGPGTLPLTWGAETPELASELEVVALPPPRNFDEAMQVVALARSAPDADPAAEGVRAGAAGADTSGDATYHRRLKPGHRRVVREFFGHDN